MAALLDHLGDLCLALGAGQHRPNEKWLRDVCFGVLTSRSLKLSEIARALDEDDANGEPRRLIHTHKRLSRGLNSDRLDDAALQAAHLSRAGRALRVDGGASCVVCLDGSVLVKPRSRTEEGRGQEGACYTWDNARGEVTSGYPMVAISGVDAQGQRRPLLLRPFSTQDPEHVDQPTEHLAALKAVWPHVGPKSVVVADRGYASRRIFDGLDGLGASWVIRAKINARRPRKLLTAEGEITDLRALAHETLPTMRTERTEGRGRKRRVHVYDISRRKVKLLDAEGEPMGPWRTLITVWSEHENPLVLLTSGWRRSKAEVLDALKVWRSRWSVELVLNTVKSKRWGIDLNGLRALTLRGVKRLCLIATALLAFVEGLTSCADVVRRVLNGFASFDHAGDPESVAQRMIRGVAGVLSRVRPDVLVSWRWRE